MVLSHYVNKAFWWCSTGAFDAFSRLPANLATYRLGESMASAPVWHNSRLTFLFTAMVKMLQNIAAIAQNG